MIMNTYKNKNLSNLKEIINGVEVTEEWRYIDGFKYMVSSFGRIKSMPKKRVSKTKNAFGVVFYTKEKILTQTKSSTGYLNLTLSINGVKHQKLVHILVANAFLINENLPEVNHKNGIKVDNRISNLEWITKSDNIKHSYSIGLIDKKGEKHHFVKITEDDVRNIRGLKETTNIKNVDLANKFNVSQQTICDILKRRSWCHI